MEILINKKFLKVNQVVLKGQNLNFKNLSTADKIQLEEWFKKIKSEGTVKGYTINTIMLDDSKLFELEGVWVCSIGDASEDFEITYDTKMLCNLDMLALITENCNLGIEI
jgi:hypothetical protein